MMSNTEKAARAAFKRAFDDLAKLDGVGPLGAIGMAVGCAQLFNNETEQDDE
jgi:hypothetical protein